MDTNDMRWCALLVDLPNILITGVERVDDTVMVTVQTADARSWCTLCGVRAVVKDRPKALLADLPYAGQPSLLRWVKYRWQCRARCGGSWTERRPDICGPGQSALTYRAGVWATIQVGFYIRPVDQVRRELGVSWETVMSAVNAHGQVLIDDPERVTTTSQIGVDETSFLKATPTSRTQFVSQVTDLERRTIVDVFQGNQHDDLSDWFNSRSTMWLDAIDVVAVDLHEPYRKAIVKHLPNALLVADVFHVVGVASRVLDKCRRRVQNETMGHRGRTGEPLYGARKLLLMAPERRALSAGADAKLDRLLAIGDPQGQVREAMLFRECVRDLYTCWGDVELAEKMIDSIIDDCNDSTVKEINGLGRTLKQWRNAILTWHSTGASNGPTEALNSVMKRIRRIATGFKNFSHYRTRILLATGGCNWTLIGHTPR
jgi:transposase